MIGPPVQIVTGTDTGVGKTIVTAALAACAIAAGWRVAVLKPAQTGTASYAPGEMSDVETVARLAGPEVTCVTLVEYPEPLAPLAAAIVSGQAELYLTDLLEATARLSDDHDVVLIEGVGGLLVPMGFGGWTIADAAVALAAPVIVVVRAGLGTLNHTALTLEALAARGITASVVIGAWPAQPELVHVRNREDLAGTVVGVVPDGAGSLDPEEFRAQAAGWF